MTRCCLLAIRSLQAALLLFSLALVEPALAEVDGPGKDRGAGSAASHQEFADGGLETCLRCHETDRIEAIFETPHMKEGTSAKTPAAREQCESCHGPSASHVRFPMHVGNIRFTRHDDTTTRATRDRACLECHRDDARSQWLESPHGGGEIACVDCHAIHRAKDPILSEETRTQQCTEGCHMEIMQKRPIETAHPLVGSDAIPCTGCHDPHGPSDLAACASCHPQQPRDLAAQSLKARGYHERAIAQGIACTECHQGFVHPLPEEVVRSEHSVHP